MRMFAVLLSLVLAGCAASMHAPRPSPIEGARYVAMGSSYAAGAWIGAIVPGSPERCGRTVNNYAHLLAQRLKLDLTDVSCGGATTAHILGRWSDLPAQMDAVTSDTQLVTVTIGGNDVGYVRDLIMATCRKKSTALAGAPCPQLQPPSKADWISLDQHMREVAREVKRRAPRARLIFVDYLSIIPSKGLCDAVPLGAKQATVSRETFRHLAALTARVARQERAILLPAGKLSERHDGCSAEPWAVGLTTRGAPWHPTAAGHAAIAEALNERLTLR